MMGPMVLWVKMDGVDLIPHSAERRAPTNKLLQFREERKTQICSPQRACDEISTTNQSDSRIGSLCHMLCVLTSFFAMGIKNINKDLLHLYIRTTYNLHFLPQKFWYYRLRELAPAPVRAHTFTPPSAGAILLHNHVHSLKMSCIPSYLMTQFN